MPTVRQLRRQIAQLRARIEKRDQLNREDAAAIVFWEGTIAKLESLERDKPGHLQPLNERRKATNVFTEYMTSTTLRERNRAISRAKSHTPLAEACRAAGLQSKNELAKKLKMSPGSLTAYEQGRTVPASVRSKIRALTKSKLHPDGFDNWPNPET